MIGEPHVQEVPTRSGRFALDIAGGLPEVIATTTSAGTTRYTQVQGQVLAQQASGAWQYVLVDHLGSVRQLVAEDAAIVLARLTADPSRLLPDQPAPITPAQQATITGLVSDLAAAAQVSGQRLGQGKSDHAAIWATLKRRFNVARYLDLTQAQYGQVVRWLEVWLQRVRGTS